MTCPYKDLRSASDWMKKIFNQSEALTGLSIVPHTSFCEKITGDVAKRRLFSQANGTIDYLQFYLLSLQTKPYRISIQMKPCFYSVFFFNQICNFSLSLLAILGLGGQWCSSIVVR